MNWDKRFRKKKYKFGDFIITKNLEGQELYNKDGKLILRYDSILLEDLYLFTSLMDTVMVVAKNKKYGLLGTDGEVRIPIEYEQLEETGFGSTFWVMKQSKWGIIDIKGQVVQPFTFSEYHGHLVKQDNHYGIINLTKLVVGSPIA